VARSSTPYRDSSGRTLEDYPRPSVAVDTAVLTVHNGGSCVLLVRDEAGEERLPGTFLHRDETLRDAAMRALREKTGVQGLSPRQLMVFDDPGRDDRGWVLSVAHLDAVRADHIPLTGRTRLVGVGELPPLGFDHAAIVAHAAEVLREDYRQQPDPWFLLRAASDGVTIRDLRVLHEAVLGQRLVPDTFRRTVLPGLEPTGEVRRGGRGKPAELYRRIRTAKGIGGGCEVSLHVDVQAETGCGTDMT